jgi:hypothetical protein
MQAMEGALDLPGLMENVEAQEAVWNTVFDEDGPRVASTKPSDKSRFVAAKLFHGFSEIFSSSERLKQIEQYIRRFPCRDTNISRLDYLKYHIENWLNEVYILKERMIAYNTAIARSYRKSNNTNFVESKLAESSKSVSASLQGVISVRGAHVHDSRYTDDDLDRLRTLELLLLAESEVTPIFRDLYLEGYKSTRRKWVKTMRSSHEAIESILNAYSQTLIECVTDGEAVIFPSNTNWA